MHPAPGLLALVEDPVYNALPADAPGRLLQKVATHYAAMVQREPEGGFVTIIPVTIYGGLGEFPATVHGDCPLPAHANGYDAGLRIAETEYTA